MLKRVHLILLLCFAPLWVFGQEKIEKEAKIPVAQVPDKAVSWLNEVFDHQTKLKWFMETGEALSYEAKFLSKRKRYSVKFKADGSLKDVEIHGKWRKLPLALRRNILKDLEAHFSKYKIVKVQVQYRGSENAIRNWVASGDLDQIIMKYEVEFYGEQTNEKKLWEGLFDKAGHLQSKREIKLTPSNNLFF